MTDDGGEVCAYLPDAAGRLHPVHHVPRPWTTQRLRCVWCGKIFPVPAEAPPTTSNPKTIRRYVTPR